MISPSRDEDSDLLQAYADGELDPAQAAAMRQKLASDPVLRAQYESILSLRRLIRTIPDDGIPLEHLRAKVASVVSSTPVERRYSWRALAAGVLIATALSSTVTFVGVRLDTAGEAATMTVANHVRGLLAAQPFDIASSDRHTIKPWFTTKLPESPPVVDLANDGFSLAGGRVDVVVRDPVPTLVYRRGPHAISLTILRGARTITGGNISGYNVKTWHDGGFTYVAVSDLPVSDLDNFADAFKRGVSQLQ